jgi:hypothetical protein
LYNIEIQEMAWFLEFDYFSFLAEFILLYALPGAIFVKAYFLFIGWLGSHPSKDYIVRVILCIAAFGLSFFCCVYAAVVFSVWSPAAFPTGGVTGIIMIELILLLHVLFAFVAMFKSCKNSNGVVRKEALAMLFGVLALLLICYAILVALAYTSMYTNYPFNATIKDMLYRINFESTLSVSASMLIKLGYVVLALPLLRMLFLYTVRSAMTYDQAVIIVLLV